MATSAVVNAPVPSFAIMTALEKQQKCLSTISPLCQSIDNADHFVNIDEHEHAKRDNSDVSVASMLTKRPENHPAMLAKLREQAGVNSTSWRLPRTTAPPPVSPTVADAESLLQDATGKIVHEDVGQHKSHSSKSPQGLSPVSSTKTTPRNADEGGSLHPAHPTACLPLQDVDLRTSLLEHGKLVDGIYMFPGLSDKMWFGGLDNKAWCLFLRRLVEEMAQRKEDERKMALSAAAAAAAVETQSQPTPPTQLPTATATPPVPSQQPSKRRKKKNHHQQYPIFQEAYNHMVPPPMMFPTVPQQYAPHWMIPPLTFPHQNQHHQHHQHQQQPSPYMMTGAGQQLPPSASHAQQQQQAPRQSGANISRGTPQQSAATKSTPNAKPTKTKAAVPNTSIHCMCGVQLLDRVSLNGHINSKHPNWFSQQFILYCDCNGGAEQPETVTDVQRLKKTSCIVHGPGTPSAVFSEYKTTTRTVGPRHDDSCEGWCGCRKWNLVPV